MPHLKKKTLSIVTPVIHRTLFCGLSKTELGGVNCEVLVAVIMHSLESYTVMRALVTYLPNYTTYNFLAPLSRSFGMHET
jgi:hypothetical protein